MSSITQAADTISTQAADTISKKQLRQENDYGFVR